jgi:serine/threonine-protein kinase
VESSLTDALASLRSALADRYRLDRELGRGGMATVYLAHDLKHDRDVALKVLRPELAVTLGPERFQREIRLAARLQHPHILTVHDSGETGGLLWFTMPFVRGESLRDRLRRERQLPVDEALRITREAALALDYAHQEGVVHRDIKPENILLTKDGSTLVADFGIARPLTGDAGLTETGLIVGTPAYMSPEQASGDKAADPRSDIYALGVVLYEMLAGEPPFTGPTAQAILTRRFTEPPPSVRRARSSVPDAVDQAIQRALAPIAADRFTTAGEFARAAQPGPTGAAAAPPVPTTPAQGLAAPPTADAHSGSRARRLPSAASLLLLGFLIGLGVLFAWRRSHAGASEGARTRVLAVLPFENLGDPADAYFADGVTDEVRGKISRLAGVEVIARTSSNEYRHTTKRAQEIAHELGADYLLTATVRWEKAGGGASRVRVTPELVDVGPGHAPRTRWQEPFDASLTDVFQVQADIAGKVASALDVALGDSARHELASKPTQNLAAYDAFLKGEAASEAMGVSDPPSLRRAMAFYRQAVALDSTFVQAWAQLARSQAYLYANSIPTPELAAGAREAAERAAALGRDRPEGPLALTDYYRIVELNNPRALAAVEPELRVAPNNVDLLVAAALAEQRRGHWEAAYQHLAKAGALDPRSANTARRTALTLIYLRRYPEAQSAADRALALAPSNLAVIKEKVDVALAQGDLAGARAVIRAGLAAVEPEALIAYLGNFDDLYWVLDNAEQRRLLTLPPSAFDNDRATWAVVLTQTYALRGDRALARAYADTALFWTTEELRAAPNDAQRHVFRGVELAYLGRKAEAIAEGERAVAMVPMSRDAFSAGYLQHQLVRIYLLVGEPEKALDRLELLLRVPYQLSPGRLRIDPTFRPLNGNPRFERLVSGT